MLACGLENLLPSVSINGDETVVRYAYWNDWQGLVQATVSVKRDGSSVRFGEKEPNVLVPYRCGIMF